MFEGEYLDGIKNEKGNKNHEDDKLTFKDENSNDKIIYETLINFKLSENN